MLNTESWLVFALNDKEILSYTLYGTFEDERENTLDLLAYEHNCKKSDIKTYIEQRDSE